MNGNRAYKIEEIERNNPQFLKRLENIISDLIESGQKENKFKEYLKEGFGTYLEYLLLLCNEKHYQSSSELNTLSILNPGMKIKDFTSTYNLYINSRATLEALEKSVNVNVELVEGIGISLADKYWIDDKLTSLKTMMRYEWGRSDTEIAECLLGQKSQSEKLEPDSPMRRYYFDQIDLSVRLNNPNLIQNNQIQNVESLTLGEDIPKEKGLPQKPKLNHKNKDYHLKAIWKSRTGDLKGYEYLISKLLEEYKPIQMPFIQKTLDEKLHWNVMSGKVQYLAALFYTLCKNEWINYYSAPDFGKIIQETFNIKVNTKPFQSLATNPPKEKYLKPFRTFKANILKKLSI